ncbi:methyltransferase type 12 [bacterium]|nr:methyltransferase type 12 [bacterium]
MADDNSRETAAASYGERTRDPVNQPLFDLYAAIGFARLGLMNNQVWHQDPKRLVFTLARYKFVAKMLKGRQAVIEYGCGDGFGARIVQQDAIERMTPPWVCEARVHNPLEGPMDGIFDAAYCLDVLEHIPATLEDRFLEHAKASLSEHGVMIVGMPSLESQAHASADSRAGHVNCKHGDDLRTLMQNHFHNVFMFSMNDEVVHTGFFPMAHYLIAIACSKRG